MMLYEGILSHKARREVIFAVLFPLDFKKEEIPSTTTLK